MAEPKKAVPVVEMRIKSGEALNFGFMFGCGFTLALFVISLAGFILTTIVGISLVNF